jgi:hypothetical protein
MQISTEETGPTHETKASNALKVAKEALEVAAEAVARAMVPVATLDSTRPGYEPALVASVAEARNDVAVAARRIDNLLTYGLDPNAPKALLGGYGMAKEQAAMMRLGRGA